jgi:RNA polymerase sigma factor (sigma-70 family)
MTVDIKEVSEQLEELIQNKESLPPKVRKVLEQYLPEYTKLIYKMAHKYVRNRVEYDDLVQEALIGLILADRDFDPTRSEDFHTYAIFRMKGKMYEYCIGNESPIYVPTHVAKAASYVKQMYRLLEGEPLMSEMSVNIEEVIRKEKHFAEIGLGVSTREDLKELKRKLGRIAFNSKMTYEKLANLAIQSISLVVSEEALAKVPEEDRDIDQLVFNQELKVRLREILGEKKFVVLALRSKGYTYQEIAVELHKIGYANRDGEVITRQAVKSIVNDIVKILDKNNISKLGQE